MNTEDRAAKLSQVLHETAQELGLNCAGLVVVDDPKDIEGEYLAITPVGMFSMDTVNILREYADKLEAYAENNPPHKDIVH